MVINMNGTTRYTIRPYDTIWMLAQVFDTTVDSIMDLNPGIDPRNLFVGQVITIRPGHQNIPPMNDITGDMEEDDQDMDNHDMDDLMNQFRMLWEQHVFWTKLAVMGLIHELPETDIILQRLLRNPVDFADVMKSYYGDEAAQNFADLLTAHLTIAAELIRAAKAGDNEAMTEADQRWRENADQIAELLGSLNPDWSVDDWSAMMNEHLDLLSADVSDMLAENYQESVNNFDEIEMQALEMADVMAEGIAIQFPE